MIKNDSYVMIPGWVLNKYGLKGNMLMIYSIIYGFCQDRESNYHGSIAYLAEWTQSTRQSVSGCLKQLCEMNLIRKEEGYPNNKYYIVFDDENKEKVDKNECKDSLQGCKESLRQCKDNLRPCKESLHNNIEYISNNIIEDTIEDLEEKPKAIYNALEKQNKHTDRYAINKTTNETITRVVGHFNKVCGTAYRANATAIQKLIKARLKDGFVEEDFIKVIDSKFNEWGLVPRKLSNSGTTADLIRPSVLFGDKMDEYLQQANKTTVADQYEVKCIRQDPTKLSTKVYY